MCVTIVVAFACCLLVTISTCNIYALCFSAVLQIISCILPKFCMLVMCVFVHICISIVVVVCMRCIVVLPAF